MNTQYYFSNTNKLQIICMQTKHSKLSFPTECWNMQILLPNTCVTQTCCNVYFCPAEVSIELNVKFKGSNLKRTQTSYTIVYLQLRLSSVHLESSKKNRPSRLCNKTALLCTTRKRQRKCGNGVCQWCITKICYRRNLLPVQASFGSRRRPDFNVHNKNKKTF